MKFLLSLLVSPILALGWYIGEADQGYTLDIKGTAFRARINKKFPSFLGVLHDAGCPLDPFIGYFYGWWTSSDFPLEGKGWVGLHMPIYRLRDVKISKENGGIRVKTEVSLKDDPFVRIRNHYIFYEGVPGFEMEREFLDEGGKRFGPAGLWLGGTISEFPISNAALPDNYFYEGKWWSNIQHSWLDLNHLQGGPQNGEYFVILYWSKTKRYLIIAIPPQGFAGGIKALRFCWRGDWKEPAWGQNTGFFSYGKFKARFLAGRGSREEAVRKATDLLQGKWAKLATPNRGRKEEGREVRYLANGYYRLGIDMRRGEVVSLQVDVSGRGKWGEDLLRGKNCRIYFGGASLWQRSIYPDEQYNLYLEPETGKTERVSNSSIHFSELTLFSPEGSPLITASLGISLEADSILLKTEFQSLRDISLPYIGWHLDFPIASWERFYNSAGGYFHRRMLENYKMSIYDLQPCYRPIGSDLIAYGGEGFLPEFSSLALEVRNEGSDTPLFVHLPNPLFDRSMSISKIAVTPCSYDWPRHNCREMSLERGKTYKLAVALRLFSPISPPSQGTFLIHLPNAPEVEKTLEMFYREHCFGGPFAPDGMIPFFWTLAGKYNPRFDLEAMRNSLEIYLTALPDGKTTRDEEGNILPRGMMPIARLGDGRWMWYWNQTGYIFETNAQFILSALEYAILSQDKEFIKMIFPKLEEAFDFYRSMVDDGNLLTLPEPYTGRPEQGRPATYWDAWCIGHRYALLQVYYCASAEAMERLALFLGEEEKVGRYEVIGERAKEALFSVYWREGDIKDNRGKKLKGGRFISWIDVNGKEMDVGFTDISLLAYYFGFLSEEKAKQVIFWLDSDPNAYSWRDERTGNPCGIPSINTVDGNKEAFYVGIWNNFQRAPGVENGQTQFWHGGFDWFMRARFSPEDAWSKIEAFARRALRGDLASGHGLPYVRPLPMYEGSNTFSADDKPVGSDQGLTEDGILITVGIIEGIAGLRMDEESLYFRPAIPQRMANLSLENIRCGEVVLNIKYRGYGERVKGLKLNGSTISQPIPRSLLKNGDLIEVIIE